MTDDNKKISIIGTNTRYQIKKVSQDKEIKTRIKSEKWSNEIMTNQYKIIEDLKNGASLTKDYELFINEINTKIGGYKQQDIKKNLLDVDNFVSLNQVINKIYDCNLTCFYCTRSLLILYTIVREKMQWTLDRIDNDKGHTNDNVIICCLECNLQRKRKSKDSFTFTKQFVLVRDEY
jgi:hypothetical protein